MASSAHAAAGNGFAGVDLAQFEMAVLCVVAPGVGDEASRRIQQATAYIQQLSSLPNAYQLCMQLLMGTSRSEARFFALQAIAQFITSPGYAALAPQSVLELRQALLMYAQGRGATLLDEQTYVRAKLALVFALLIKVDYPERWPAAFSDLLALLSSLGFSASEHQALSSAVASGAGGGSNPSTGTAAALSRPALAGLDLFLRILSALQEEVVDPRINRPDSELARNMAVKDSMRVSGDVGRCVECCYALLARSVDHMTAAEARSRAWQAGRGAALPPTDAPLIGVCRSALAVLSSYASWIDIKLLANEPFCRLYIALLSCGYTRLPVASLLQALCDKGMDDTARLELIRVMRLVDVCATLAAGVESALGGGGQAASASGAPASVGPAGGAASSSSAAAAAGKPCIPALTRSSPQHASTAAAGAGAGSSFDPDRPYGITGCDDDCDLGEAVSNLVCTVGTAIMAAGESIGVLGNAEACAWAGGALRACIDMAIRLLDVSHADCGVGTAILPFLHALVACLQREFKVARDAASGGAGAASAASLGGAAQVASPEFKPLVPPAANAPPSLSLTSAASSASVSSSTAVLGNTSGSPDVGSAKSETAAFLRAYAGRPAGVSASEYMVRLVLVICRQYVLPGDFTFSGGGGDIGSDDDDGDEEDEAGLIELREGLKKAYVNIVRLAPDAVVQLLESTVLTRDAIALLPRLPWPQAEACLSLCYHIGEGAAAMAGALRGGQGVLFNLLSSVFASGVQAHPHHAVVVVFFEMAARYHTILIPRPQLLPVVLESMIGVSGLRHRLPSVRSRTAYLLLKLVKSTIKGNTSGEAAGLLNPYVGGLLKGIESFLSVPFVYNDGASSPTHANGLSGVGASPPRGLDKPASSAAAAAKSGSAGGAGSSAGATGDLTRGPSGLGSDDAVYLFELVGTIVGAAWVDSGTRATYTEAVATPLLASLNDGLARVAAMTGSSGGGAGDAAAVAAAAAAAGAAVPASASPEFIFAVSAWIVRVMNAVGHLTKGLGNVTSQGEERLARLQENILAGVIRAVAVLPRDQSVRAKALFLLHRMVDCLETRLLQHMPSVMPALLSASTPDDMIGVLVLLNQLAAKFKLAAAPLLATCLLPIISQVFAVMPPPAPTGQTAGPSASGSGRGSNVPQAQGRGTGRPPRKDSDAMVGSGSAPTTPAIDRDGDGSGSGGGRGGGGLVTTDDTRARLELQKQYALFLQQVAAHGLATAVLAAPPNDGRLLEILGTALAMLATATDASLQKTCLQFLQLLVKTWLPVTHLPIAQQQQGQQTQQAAAAPVPAAPGPIGFGAIAAPSAVAAGLSPVRVEAQASPLPPQLRQAFLAFLFDHALRASVTLVGAPGFDTSDAQGQAVMTEALILQAVIAIHVAAALGGQAPSKVPGQQLDPTAAAAPASGQPDAISVLCGSILPQLGCPLQLAGQYGERLRLSLGNPKEARPAYVAIAKAIRAAATAPR